MGPKSRTERARKTKIGTEALCDYALYKSTFTLHYITEVARVTRDSYTTLKVKRLKVKGRDHQAALLSAALTREVAAAVSVGNCCNVAVCSAQATC